MKVPFDKSPDWKPPSTLLGAAKPYADCITLDFNRQWEWGVNEWREYARLLNKELAFSNRKLSECQSDLKACKLKSSRRTTPIKRKHLTGTLLTGYAETKVKRGRKQGGGKCHDLAVEALRRRTEKESKGIKVTDAQVIEELLIELLPSGQRQSRVRGQVRGVKNAISKIRNHI